MRLWHFSSSVNSFFKYACAAIQWDLMCDFSQTLPLPPYFMCANSDGSGETARMRSSPEPSLVAYVISTIISFMSWLVYMFPSHLNQTRHFHRLFHRSSSFLKKKKTFNFQEIRENAVSLAYPMATQYSSKCLFHPVT